MSNDKDPLWEKSLSGSAFETGHSGQNPSSLSPDTSSPAFHNAQTSQQRRGVSSTPLSNQPGRRQKKRPSMGIIILIVVLILALVGGGYSIYRYFNGSRTVTASPHKLVIVTPAVPPIFSDTFQNNAAHWDMDPPAGAGITLADNGKLVLEIENHTTFTEPLPGRTTLGDFRLDVDAGLTGGDEHNSYGVFIRISTGPIDPVSLYYRFEIFGDGSFAVLRGSEYGDGSLRVTPLKHSLQPSKAVAHAGSSNHLTIIAKGQALTLIVNGTTLVDFIDGGYSSGYTALFVSQAKDARTPAQAAFQNLALFPV